MLLDDLDFFLLDLVVDFRFSLRALSFTEAALNRPIPPHTEIELIAALHDLFTRGDAVARIPTGGRPFLPTPDEIEAGLRGAIDIVYGLTPQGGRRWERTVQPDWSLYLSATVSRRFSWTEAQTREHLEYWLEIERARDRIGKRIEWKGLRPWRPVYWKELPSGFRVRYTLTGRDDGLGCPDPPWGTLCTPEFHRGPRNLAPRKERSAPAPVVSRPLRKLESARGARARFAAACDCAPQADLSELLQWLPYRFGEVRFTAVRELARRKEREAVPALLGLVLRAQYLPALWALGEIADERALPVFAILLEYGHACGLPWGSLWHRTFVRALARFGDAAMPLLEKSLASGNAAAADLAKHALALMRPESATPQRRREQHRPPICEIGAALSDPDRIRPRSAIDLLVELESRDHLPEIERLAQDPDWDVRASVAYALRRPGGSRKLLRVLAGDTNPAVRWLATKDLITRS